MSGEQEFEGVEDVLEERLPEKELEEVWRVLYGRRLE